MHATARAVAVSIDDQLADMVSCLASLDLQPTELVFEDPCSESSIGGCQNEESKLPPPRPYFDRHARTPPPAPKLMQDIFSRVKSDVTPITHRCGASTEFVLQHKGMTQSMPNLHSSRSMYNRGLGYSVLSSATECGGKPGKHAMRARVEEFEALLEDL